MFTHKWWQISKFANYNELCPVCNLRFDREPGFFIGAMYVSYGMIVAMVAIVWCILYFIFSDPIFEVYIGVIVSLNIILLPLIFRYSRILYLYGFGGVQYNQKLNKIDK
jgi:hypothetical protein